MQKCKAVFHRTTDAALRTVHCGQRASSSYSSLARARSNEWS